MVVVDVAVGSVHFGECVVVHGRVVCGGHAVFILVGYVQVGESRVNIVGVHGGRVAHPFDSHAHVWLFRADVGAKLFEHVVLVLHDVLRGNGVPVRFVVAKLAFEA